MQSSDRNEARWLERLEWSRRQRDELARLIAPAAGDGAEDEGPEPLDRALTFRWRFTNEAMLRVLADNQRQLERALERLHEGRYGVCEDCGARIQAQRLRLAPEATRCVICQRVAEGLPSAG